MNFTETVIRMRSTAQSFDRGENYWHNGAVLELYRRGRVVHATVEGNHYEPYQVTIMFDRQQKLEDCHCTCPYDWGGDCKHIVAVLLTLLHDSPSLPDRPSVDALLGDLSEMQLRQLLETLLFRDPYLIEQAETLIRQEIKE